MYGKAPSDIDRTNETPAWVHSVVQCMDSPAEYGRGEVAIVIKLFNQIMEWVTKRYTRVQRKNPHQYPKEKTNLLGRYSSAATELRNVLTLPNTGKTW